ncbi:hypothetical protein FZ983_07515 [Azospirillum sp. B21]|nr:hypothetical protein FZ983_07515 [Azospirillum sp. B21]
MLPATRRNRIVQQTAQRIRVAMSHLSLTTRPCSSSSPRNAMRRERHLSIDRLQTAVGAWRMVRVAAIVARANVGQAPGQVRMTTPARPNPFDHT